MASSGPRIATALAVHADLALVRRVEAGGDVHQRGLAGAVLAEERMDLAGEDGEIRRRQRHEAVERFRDSGEFEGRDHGRLAKRNRAATEHYLDRGLVASTIAG